MKNSENISFRYRYPGGRPFSEQDRELFFGRQKDLKALTNLIFLKQTVVLFGKSGYGKSSLINAGVIPELKKHEGIGYFSVRFNNYWKTTDGQSPTPVESVIRRFSESFRFDENDFSKFIPNENSFWYWIKLHQWSNPNHKFIIFFDQFEELFRYPDEQIQLFSDQLVRLLFNAVPINYRKKLENSTHDGSVNVELTRFLNKTPDIKVIFSMRTDSVAQINRLANKLPFILQNCYELDALSAINAAEAIKKPASLIDLSFKAPEFEFEDEAISVIINSISSDNKIEGTALQILLRHIEENIVIKDNERLISVKRLGKINDIFQEYYETVLSKFSDEEKEIVYNLLENHLIVDGNRNALNFQTIERNLKADPTIGKKLKADSKLLKNLLDTLEQSSLVIKEDDARRKEIYEIGHDTIAQAVIRVASLRHEQQQEKEKQEAQRKEEELRNEKEIKQKKEFEQQIEEKRTQEKEYKKQIEKDRQEALILKRRQRHLKYSIAAIGLACIFSIAAFGWSTHLASSLKIADIKNKALIDSLKAEKKNTAKERAKKEIDDGDALRSIAYPISKIDRRLDNINEALRNYRNAQNLMEDFKQDSLYIVIIKGIDQMEREAKTIKIKLNSNIE
jgi:hypothetical protein